LEPGDAADYDAYMRYEHLEQFRGEPGWKRSRRYRCLGQTNGPLTEGMQEGDAASWFAMYEFDKNNKLGTQVQALEPMTEWTKRVSAAAKKMELGVFRRFF
jgi:hypothetical protein